jgi:hypothetical protein
MHDGSGVATKVMGVVMTSSPAPIPKANKDSCNPAVALVRPMTYFSPKNSANFFSNRATSSPVVRKMVFMTWVKRFRFFSPS